MRSDSDQRIYIRRSPGCPAFVPGLVPIVAVLATGRLLAWVAYLISALRSMPALRSRLVLARHHVGYVLALGPG